ncbi:MAG TPA: right-handed parallel beta-helix repeat-containing protein [Pyrinomonadaceae bacterium]|nr:right-handed parallel beta-helix repeat-containing protein [Pyrinomonadaceae bacterium]
MTKSGITIKALASPIFALALCVTAQAQTRVFVSGVGSDVNPCSRTAPCRTFQQAHNVVSAGGEVVTLDSAGYGPLTITKSVSIIGDGVYAGISTSSGNGINIATAGITVILRSLTIEGLGSGTYGINASDFTVLHIENCVVNGFVSDGIVVQPLTTGTRKAFIKNCISRNNGNLGIRLNNGFNVSGTPLEARVDGTRAGNNVGVGIMSNGTGAKVTASSCLSSGNNDAGFWSGSGGVLNIESSVASTNGAEGVVSSAGTVRVSNSMVTNNTLQGFRNIGGIFESRGNNTVEGNNPGGNQVDGGITPITGT